MKVSNIPRIKLEDFPEDQREAWETFSSVWNSFVDQFVQLVDKNIDFDNLSQELKPVSFTTDGSGQPLGGLIINTSLNRNINGLIPISVKLPNNPQSVVTTQPLVNFNQDGQKITIPFIGGLQPNTKYSLVLLIV